MSSQIKNLDFLSVSREPYSSYLGGNEFTESGAAVGGGAMDLETCLH